MLGTSTSADRAFFDNAQLSWSQRLLAWQRYIRVVLVALISLPLLVYAVVSSLRWFEAPFPAFLLTANNVVPTFGTFDWPADREALFHSRLVGVDDEAVNNSAAVYARVAAQPAGTVFHYTFERDGVRFERAIASRQFTAGDYLQTYGLVFLVGGSYLAFGLIVGFLQPNGRQARVFLLQACVAGLFPITGIFLHQPDQPSLARANLVLECFFGATWIHLALVFPTASPATLRERAAALLPYCLSALLSAQVLHGFFSQPPDLRYLHLTYSYHAASIVFFVVAMGFRYARARDALTRPRILALLPGVLLASILPLVAFIDNARSGRAFPVQFALLFIPFLQASVAYAIVKHDLFDIDRVVRQSFIYATLSLIVAGTYAIVLVTITRFAPALGDQHQAWIGVSFALVMALALNPLRRGVQMFIDRAFYRTQLDYRATISSLSNVMTTLLDLDEIAAQVTRVPTEAMHLQCAALYLLTVDGVRKWRRDAGGALHQGVAAPELRELADALRRADGSVVAEESLSRLPDASRAATIRRCLQADGVDIILPLRFRQQVVGIFGLGLKRSGRRFGRDDIELLRTLANQTAIAVQNARSYAGLQELALTLDLQVREQTEALRDSHRALQTAYDELQAAQAQLVQSEKLASLGQLVAGVAHELNNPASFIHGGLANLSEYLQRIQRVLISYEALPLPAAQRESMRNLREQYRLDYVLRETPELLRICSEGSERIRKIVEDLRLFARAERGDRKLTSIAKAIDSSLVLMRERTPPAVTVIRSYNDIPPVPLDVDLLSHVWLNLLGNAVDALENQPQPRIEIDVQMLAAANGREMVQVQIHDNGHGIAAADLPRIFEPFFTTKPIGHGTGLGLSISYGAVKSHGGTIEVNSELGVGTTVTVCLPGRDPVNPPIE